MSKPDSTNVGYLRVTDDDVTALCACIVSRIQENRRDGMSDHDESSTTSSGNLFNLMRRLERLWRKGLP